MIVWYIVVPASRNDLRSTGVTFIGRCPAVYRTLEEPSSCCWMVPNTHKED
jgi:hypothetical protein